MGVVNFLFSPSSSSPFLEEEEKDEEKEEKEEKEEIDYARACGRLFPHVGLVYFLVPYP